MTYSNYTVIDDITSLQTLSTLAQAWHEGLNVCTTARKQSQRTSCLKEIGIGLWIFFLFTYKILSGSETRLWIYMRNWDYLKSTHLSIPIAVLLTRFLHPWRCGCCCGVLLLCALLGFWSPSLGSFTLPLAVSRLLPVFSCSVRLRKIQLRIK